MVSCEFGRTPKINADAGRDHWPKVFSVVLAGGGIKRGTIYGSSNATASEPEGDPIGPEDLATTVYHLLGIVADKELMAPGNRPIEIVDGGKVVKELLAEVPLLFVAFVRVACEGQIFLRRVRSQRPNERSLAGSNEGRPLLAL